jgi:hypothetical protein
MKVGELGILAGWCKDGPAVMRIVDIDFEYRDRSQYFAMFFEGPKFGEVCKVNKDNLFPIEKYEECMQIRKETNSWQEYRKKLKEVVE